MLRFFAICSLIFVTLLLSSCSFTKVHYTYHPPQLRSDKICVSRCARAKNYCQNICNLKKTSCGVRASRTADYRYAVYKREQERKGERVVKTPRDFYHVPVCRHTTCDCITSYNTCYMACGGEVEAAYF